MEEEVPGSVLRDQNQDEAALPLVLDRNSIICYHLYNTSFLLDRVPWLEQLMYLDQGGRVPRMTVIDEVVRLPLDPSDSNPLHRRHLHLHLLLLLDNPSRKRIDDYRMPRWLSQEEVWVVLRIDRRDRA